MPIPAEIPLQRGGLWCLLIPTGTPLSDLASQIPHEAAQLQLLSLVRMLQTPSLVVRVQDRGQFSNRDEYLSAATAGKLASNPAWQDHPAWEAAEAVRSLGRLHQDVADLLDVNNPLVRLEYLQINITPGLDGFGWIIYCGVPGPAPPHLYATDSASVLFDISLHIPATYPNKVPEVFFEQLFYHPNVEERTLRVQQPFFDRLQWNASKTLRDVISQIISLMETPVPDPPPSDHDIRHMWHHEAPEKLELSPEALKEELAKFKEAFYKQRFEPRALSLAQYQHERLCIQHKYNPLYPRIFDATKPFEAEWFDPTLWSALQSGQPATIKSLVKQEAPGLYYVPFFSPEFCQVFLEEIINFEKSGLPWRRPNSMNRYGVVIDDIGMESIMTKLQNEVIGPIASLLFPNEGGTSLDRHHAFVVQYKTGEDVKLDMHTDDSEVTLNVCLGKPGFVGSGLSFCGLAGEKDYLKYKCQYFHSIGRAVIHLGRHRHGADEITSGERYNLIVWSTSNKLRSNPHRAHRHGHPQQMQDADQRCLKSNGRV